VDADRESATRRTAHGGDFNDAPPF